MINVRKGGKTMSWKTQSRCRVSERCPTVLRLPPPAGRMRDLSHVHSLFKLIAWHYFKEFNPIGFPIAAIYRPFTFYETQIYSTTKESYRMLNRLNEKILDKVANNAALLILYNVHANWSRRILLKFYLTTNARCSDLLPSNVSYLIETFSRELKLM